MKWPLHYKQASLMQASPRIVLRRQLDKLKDLGYELMSAFEIEFTLLNPDTFEPVFPQKYAALTQTHATFEDYFYTIERNCEKAGVDIKDLRIECGRGKFELVMATKYGVETCDDVFVTKELVKEISESRGYLATFMSYAFEGLSTQGSHLNLSLWKNSIDGQLINAFYDESGPETLTNVFRHFLAGLIYHGKALCAFWCPTVNCYRRMNIFKVLPRFDWDIDNRKSTFRVKNDVTKSPYLECRKLSSACNPYLATAAILVAGIDGIRKQIPLPERNAELFVPGKERQTREENLKGDTMPQSLDEALDELEKNEVLKEGLGEELVRWFVDLKREMEILVTSSLTDQEKWKKERELYLRFI